MRVSKENLSLIFTYHPPKADQQKRYQAIRNAALQLATTIVENTQGSEEQTLAVRKIQEAVAWANAGIALNG